MQERAAEPFAPDRAAQGPAGAGPCPTPQQLRAMFGHNLRQLVASEPTVADLCRRLGINRSQFNRYLQGEAFPRPDILHRICAHFGVDARILLEPLEAQRAAPCPATPLAAALAALGTAMAGRDVTVAPGMLPDGLYRFWRRSFSQRDLALSTICRIWREGGVTRFRAREPVLPNPVMPGPVQGGSLAPHHGVFLRAEDGVTLLCAIPGSRILRLSFLRAGHAGVATLFPGYSALTRHRADGLLRLVPSLLERLPDQIAPRLAAARSRGYHRPETLPDLLRGILMAESLG